MINATLSYFDAIVVGVIAISCLFAFFRGFVKEILSLGAWIGAGIITLYYFPDVAAMLEPRFKSPMVAAGIATLAIYITALLCFSLINSLIFRYVKEGSDVGILDNTLGLVFGFIRGAFLVSLGYLLMTMVLPEGDEPDWLKASYTKPYVEQGAKVLAQAAPKYMQDISSLDVKDEDKRTNKEKKTKEDEGKVFLPAVFPEKKPAASN